MFEVSKGELFRPLSVAIHNAEVINLNYPYFKASSRMHYQYPTILGLQLTALNALGIVCIALICFGLPAELIMNTYRKPKKLKKGEKRILAINKISRWDYLIIIIPVWLVLIIFFGSDYGERTMSMFILGLGYGGLIFSPYNRRIDIPAINLFVTAVCLLMLVSGVIIQFNVIELSKAREVRLLYAPPAAYVYLKLSRYVIKQITGTYPITMFRGDPVGEFNERYNRKTTYWDLAWSLFNILLWLPILIILA